MHLRYKTSRVVVALAVRQMENNVLFNNGKFFSLLNLFNNRIYDKDYICTVAEIPAALQ